MLFEYSHGIGLEGGVVVIGEITDHVSEVKDKLLLSLANIEQDKTYPDMRN